MTILTAVLFALQQTDPGSLEPRVAAYAQQLREESTRDRARDRLVHLGRPALPLLEKLAIEPAALSSIRQEIAFNETLGASYGAPKTFSFDGSEETLNALLTKLENGAGVTFQRNSLDLSQKFSLRLDDVPYWEALDEICKKGTIWYFPSHDPIYLNGGMVSGKPRVYYGPLMIVMDRLIQQRKISFEKIDNEYLIRVMCVWEKHVSPLGPTGRVQLTQVTDDTGASLILLPRPPPPPKPALGVRVVGQTVDLTGLRAPSPEAKKLSRVEGTLELEFPARIDEVRIEVQADNPTATKEIDGAVLELKSFTPQSSWGAAAEFHLKFRDPKEAAAFRIGTNDIEFIASGDARRQGWIGATSR